MSKIHWIVCIVIGIMLTFGMGSGKDGDLAAKELFKKETRTLTYTYSALLKAIPVKPSKRPSLSAALHRGEMDELVTWANKNQHRPAQYMQKFRGNISAYTNGLSETGKSSRHPLYGITASGHRTKVGTTVAAGRHIPFGTVLYIEGVGYRVVHDRGGAIKGNKIDVFVSSMGQAKTFGRQSLDVYVVKWGDGKRKRR
ncbi:3D domain-containing protein [Aneurinibacillus sp. REN35]|uniref:3D domain-containing protein n=1 Tax=Aneurinibacillus sp. REN35 TaxID=3237286 RepID=UPI0035284463